MKTGAGSAAFFDRSVEEIFDAYPPLVQKKLLDVRELIFQVAASYPEIGLVQECLKWGEPSYLAKGGSTLRMNARGPDKYAVYFHCKTRLVETFKEIYGDFFVTKRIAPWCFPPCRICQKMRCGIVLPHRCAITG